MSFFLDFLFPPFCISCSSSTQTSRFIYLCERCAARLPWMMHQRCPYCQKKSVGGNTHPICRRKYGLDGTVSLFFYVFPIPQLVRKWKYTFVRNIEQDIGILLQEWQLRCRFPISFEKGIMTPIPISSKRLFWRGFNQSEVLAKKLVSSFGGSYKKVLRKKQTPPQVGLSKKERYFNVRGAFDVEKKDIGNTSLVFLVDDVWTTGSTLKEVARVLKQKGKVGKVWGVTFARSLRRRA